MWLRFRTPPRIARRLRPSSAEMPPYAAASIWSMVPGRSRAAARRRSRPARRPRRRSRRAAGGAAHQHAAADADFARRAWKSSAPRSGVSAKPAQRHHAAAGPGFTSPFLASKVTIVHLWFSSVNSGGVQAACVLVDDAAVAAPPRRPQSVVFPANLARFGARGDGGGQHPSLECFELPSASKASRSDFDCRWKTEFRVLRPAPAGHRRDPKFPPNLGVGHRLPSRSSRFGPAAAGAAALLSNCVLSIRLPPILTEALKVYVKAPNYRALSLNPRGKFPLFLPAWAARLQVAFLCHRHSRPSSAQQSRLPTDRRPRGGFFDYILSARVRGCAAQPTPPSSLRRASAASASFFFWGAAPTGTRRAGVAASGAARCHRPKPPLSPRHRSRHSAAIRSKIGSWTRPCGRSVIWRSSRGCTARPTIGGHLLPGRGTGLPVGSTWVNETRRRGWLRERLGLPPARPDARAPTGPSAPVPVRCAPATAALGSR